MKTNQKRRRAADEERAGLQHRTAAGDYAGMRAELTAGNPDGETKRAALREAVKAGDTLAARILIDGGVDLDHRGEAFETSFVTQAAAKAGAGMLRLLLDAGARAAPGEDPIAEHVFGAHDHRRGFSDTGMIEALHAHGCNVTNRTVEAAVTWGDDQALDLIGQLTDDGPVKIAPGVLARTWRDHETEPEVENSYDVIRGPQLLRVLLDHGADPNGTIGPKDERPAKTLLIDAAAHGAGWAVNALVGAGADVEAARGWLQSNSLRIAPRAGANQVVAALQTLLLTAPERTTEGVR